MVTGEAGSGKSARIVAHIAGGLTVHCFLKLDVNLNTYLEMGTISAYFVKKVKVVMIDEVPMME